MNLQDKIMTGNMRKRTHSQGPSGVGWLRREKVEHFLHSNCTGHEESVKQFMAQLQAPTAQYSQEDLDASIVDAVRRRHKECVKPLLDAGASVHARSEYSRSLLCLATYDHKPGCYGAFDVNRNIIEQLVLAGIDVNEMFWELSGNFPLFVILTLKGLQYFDLVEFLLSHGADVNGTGNTANPLDEKGVRHLTIIAIRARPIYTKLFLEYGADPNGLSFYHSSGDTIPIFPTICAVILLGKLEIMKYLLLYNARTDIQNLSPWFHGSALVKIVFLAQNALKTKVKMLEMLLKFGCRMWPMKHLLMSEDFPHLDVDLSVFYRKPLSLLEHSRIAVLHAMGRKYLSNIHSLQIPTSLHSYLEFNDVNVEEKPD